MSTDNLRKAAVKGVFWTSIEKFGSQILSLVLGVIIARILTPADYGIIGMTAIFMAVATTLIDSGFGSALIQNQKRSNDDFSACFYFNVFLAVGLYAVLFMFSPLLSDFYSQPVLTPLVRVLGLTLIFNSFTVSQTAMLTVEFRFRDLCIATIGSQFVTGIVALILALKGFGVWALVGQQISASALRVILITYFTRWLPTLSFKKAAFRRLFSYGSKITCSSLINTIYTNRYTLVIGKVFSAVDVGYYTRGNQFAALPAQTLLQIIMKIAFPLMAKVQDETTRLRNAYQKFLRMSVYVLYPILAGLAVLAEPFILVLLGEKWLGCVPYLQIMCIGAMFDPLTHINLNILYVKGRTDLVLKLELIKKPIAFALLFASIPFGIMWVCASWSLYGFIAYCFNCYYTARYINLGFWKQMVFCLPVIIKSCIMGAACFAAASFITNPALQLAAGTATGITAYWLLSFITHDESLADIKDIVMRKKKT